MLRSLALISLCLSLIFVACSDDESSNGGNLLSTSSGGSISSSQSVSSSVTSGAASSAAASSSVSSGAASSATAATIYISEYVEGSVNNKYIELYNPTSDPVSLTGWSIKNYLNGATSPTSTCALTGSIPAGGIYVIRREPTGTWTGTADQTETGDVLNFNGNDPVALYLGATLIDIVGTPGNATDHIKDMTLVRKPGRSAATTWSLDDWYQHAADTVSFLGAHDPDSNSAEPGLSAAALPVEYPHGTAGGEVYISEYFQGDGNDKYIEIFNNTGSLGSLVSLADYRLVRIDVDNTTGATNLLKSWCIQLSGQLRYFNTLLIVHGGYDPVRLTTLAGVPQVTAMDQYAETRKYLESPSFYPKAVCFFGGNDPIYLVKAGAVIDAVGTPATHYSWGEKRAFVRKSGKSANPVWNIDDWDIVETVTAAPGSVYNDGSDSSAGEHLP